MNELDEQRLEDVITFLVSRTPKVLTRTALLKLLYFADLRSYEKKGRPITALKWIWHFYGPFAPAVYDALNAMNANDEVQVDVRLTPYGNPEYRLTPGPAHGFYQVLNAAEHALLQDVLKEFGRYPAMKLRDFSYQTLPMKQVMQRGDELDFEPYCSADPPARFVPDRSAKPSARISSS
jgi:uncharacterized phage-associated protein